MTPQQDELKRLIRSKLRPDMTPDQATDAVMTLFEYVEDYWRETDVATLGEPRGSRYLDSRSLCCYIQRESVERRRVEDRRVPGDD